MPLKEFFEMVDLAIWIVSFVICASAFLVVLGAMVWLFAWLWKAGHRPDPQHPIIFGVNHQNWPEAATAADLASEAGRIAMYAADDVKWAATKRTGVRRRFLAA
jgi:hypothetical protein